MLRYLWWKKSLYCNGNLLVIKKENLFCNNLLKTFDKNTIELKWNSKVKLFYEKPEFYKNINIFRKKNSFKSYKIFLSSWLLGEVGDLGRFCSPTQASTKLFHSGLISLVRTMFPFWHFILGSFLIGGEAPSAVGTPSS